MSGKELWEAFIMENNFVECHYETWAFGVEADLLAHLVATGEKNCYRFSLSSVRIGKRTSACNRSV